MTTPNDLMQSTFFQMPSTPTPVVRRLAYASLDVAIGDPQDRSTLAMSTLIQSEVWLLETTWDGKGIGDVQVFKNHACGPNGNRLIADGKPMADDWRWWGGVPRGRIKLYRFVDASEFRPATADDPEPEIASAQREAKPGSFGQKESKRP